MRYAWPLVLSVAYGCSGDGGGGAGGVGGGGGAPLPPPLEPLPAAEHAETDRLVTSEVCAQCHLAADAPVMHDPNGDDLSPVATFRASMMALAARDPYYLAVVSQETARFPASSSTIVGTCARCHAPAAAVEHDAKGTVVGWGPLTKGTTPLDHLARDGVGCALCHQLEGYDLGGVFEVGFDRTIRGPHANPKTDPMSFFLDYLPSYDPSFGEAELCGSCHTVVVPAVDADGAPLGGDYLEQAPYLEWLSSSYAGAGTSCATCHMPTVDSTDAAIVTPISKFPDGLSPRQPFGVHRFSGGNAYMLRLMGSNVDWVGADVSAAALELAALAAEEHLRSAATLSVAASLDGGALVVDVGVHNETGHKLPTGYPGRRAWLHVRALSASGAVLFESGAWDASGALVSPSGERLDPPGAWLPHRDVIDAEDQVQVWEAVAVDASGAPTNLAFGSVGHVKDDRILPDGFAPTPEWASWLAPAGVEGDATFAPGSDHVLVRVPGGASVASVEVELVYQTVRPAELELLAGVATPAAVAFTSMADPPTPIVLAAASWAP